MAPVPVGMEPGTPYGASIEGLATDLRYTHAIGDERLSALFGQVFGVPISAGALANRFQRVHTRLDDRVAEILTRLRTSVSARWRLSGGSAQLGVRRPGAARAAGAHHSATPHAATVAAGPPQGPSPGYGWCRTRWSCATLALTRQVNRGLTVSAETRRRWLHETGWVWQRAKLVAQDDDPQRVHRLARSHSHRLPKLASWMPQAPGGGDDARPDPETCTRLRASIWRLERCTPAWGDANHYAGP